MADEHDQQDESEMDENKAETYLDSNGDPMESEEDDDDCAYELNSAASNSLLREYWTTPVENVEGVKNVTELFIAVVMSFHKLKAEKRWKAVANQMDEYGYPTPGDGSLDDVARKCQLKYGKLSKQFRDHLNYLNSGGKRKTPPKHFQFMLQKSQNNSSLLVLPNVSSAEVAMASRDYWRTPVENVEGVTTVAELLIEVAQLFRKSKSEKRWKAVAKKLDQYGYPIPEAASLEEAARKCQVKYANLARKFKSYLGHIKSGSAEGKIMPKHFNFMLNKTKYSLSSASPPYIDDTLPELSPDKGMSPVSSPSSPPGPSTESLPNNISNVSFPINASDIVSTMSTSTNSTITTMINAVKEQTNVQKEYINLAKAFFESQNRLKEQELKQKERAIEALEKLLSRSRNSQGRKRRRDAPEDSE